MDEQTVTTRHRNFSPWWQWMVRLGSTVPDDPLPPGSGEVEPLAAWLDRRRKALDELLGRLPERVPLDLETVGVEPGPGYQRYRVVYDTEDTMSVPAYLLVPDGRTAPGPAVLAIHGHGPGKGAICGLDDTAPGGGTYAHDLAQRGYVVLAPDLRCFGERADWNPPDHYACDTNLVHAVMAGWNPLTQNLWDLARSLDVLAGHPLVDDRRLGVVGFSYGATMALFLAAWDPRVTVAVVSGYLSSWSEAHKVPWNMCGSQVLWGMLGRLEHVDLAALVAPRPLLVESGNEDILFPVSAARATLEAIRPLYDTSDVDERLQHSVVEGEHRWNGVDAYPFLDRWLEHRAATP